MARQYRRSYIQELSDRCLVHLLCLVMGRGNGNGNGTCKQEMIGVEYLAFGCRRGQKNVVMV